MALAEKLKNNIVVVFVTLLLAVAGGVAKLAFDWSERAFDTKLTQRMNEFKEEHRSETSGLLAQLRDQNEQLLRDIETISKKRFSRSPKDCSRNTFCETLYWTDKVVNPHLGDHELEVHQDEFFNGVVWARSMPADGQNYGSARAGGHLNLYKVSKPYGEILRSQERATDADAEHIWLMGDAIRVEGHPFYSRLTPFVVVLRGKTQESNEAAVELGEGLKGKSSLGPAWQRFRADLEQRVGLIEFANAETAKRMDRDRVPESQAHRLQIKHIETLGSAGDNPVVKAHFRHIIKGVTVNGKPRTTVYLHEIIFYMSSRGGDDYIVKSVVPTLEKRLHKEKELWQFVKDWWVDFKFIPSAA